MTTDASLADEIRSTAKEMFAAGRAVDAEELAEMGLSELLAEHPMTAITTLAEVQGWELGRSRLVEIAMDHVLGIDPCHHALAFPIEDRTGTAGVDALVLGPPPAEVLVPIHRGARVDLYPVVHGTSSPITGIDPSARWHRLRGGETGGACYQVDPELWNEATRLGALGLAHEIIGVCSRMLHIASEHVSERHQFGVAIGSFQAVQHRLADVFVHVEQARAIARAAWTVTDATLASGALAAARLALRETIRHCHQVLGGIGCTWDHPMHLLIRRGTLLMVILDPDEALHRAVTDGSLLRWTDVDVLAE